MQSLGTEIGLEKSDKEKLKEKCLKLEAYSRRDNVILYGLADARIETVEETQTKVRVVLTTTQYDGGLYRVLYPRHNLSLAKLFLQRILRI